MSKHMTKIALCSVALLAVAVKPAKSETGQGGIPELFESSFAHEATGKLDRSLNDALKILRIDPKHYIANYRVAWLYYRKGRYSESIKFYKKAASLKPGAIEPKLGEMLPLMASRRWGEAESIGKNVLKSAPKNYLASSRLAYIYFSEGKYKAALDQYKAVLENFPSEIEMMLGLGWTYLKMGRKAEARDMFESVLSIRRKNLNATAGLEAL